MSSTNPSRGIVGRIAAVTLSVAIIAAAGWLFINRQYVVDTASVWSYQPGADIVSVADRSKMTEKSRFIFYATKPEIANAETFNKDCPRKETSSPILGCYTNDRIYVFSVSDPRLDGIEEVTAAHEMLHAVWQRHSQAERDRLTSLLTDVYERGVSPAFKERMSYYERNEPGELVNELHSILATEVKDLSPELETYYKQYFTDRSAVVALHDKYSSVYDSIINQSDELFKELTNLNQEIATDSAAYTQRSAELSRDIDAFNQRASNGGFSSQSVFSAERSRLIARSNAIESERQSINAKIDLYSQKQLKYEALGAELEGLNKSIDSIKSLEQAPTL